MKKYIIGFLIILVIGISIYGKIQLNSLQNDVTKWQNKTAKYKKKVHTRRTWGRTHSNENTCRDNPSQHRVRHRSNYVPPDRWTNTRLLKL